MISKNDINTLPGTNVIDSDGDKVGDVSQVYVSDDGSEPLFITVKTGLFGLKETFVPLENASLTQDGLRVGYDKQVIKDAPRVDADQHLSDDEQSSLFDYYDQRAGGTSADRSAPATSGLGNSGDRGYDADSSRTAGYDADSSRTGGYDADADRTRGLDADRTRTGAGHDTSGPDTDDAITLSAERLKTGVQQVQTGRARIRKHIVTEQQTVTVPVSHDEVRIEREPITDGNVGAALDGPELSEEEHEVVLTEERPVVEKETVPVERVRLETERVTEQRQVTEDVRHEEIETEGIDDTRR